MRQLEWPTLGLICACYGGWLMVGFWIWPLAPVAALILMTALAGLHSSLTHECAHGHPTRIGWLNEALITWNIGLIWPYRRFRTMHLRHHADERLTDPLEDPESFYIAAWKHKEMPGALRVLLRINTSMLGRLVVGPWLGTYGLLRGDLALIAAGDRKVLVAWALHLASLVPIILCLRAMGIPIWLYLITVGWGAAALIAIRSFAEHQWAEHPDGRTIIVESPVLGWMFLHNNLHFVHHKKPTVPWYQLPALYRERRAEWLEQNGGYLFSCYLSMFRAHGLQAKEPVAHPVLHVHGPQ